MDKLENKLWDELEELDEKVAKEGKLSAADVGLAHTVTSTLYKLDRLCGGEGYSGAGDWEAAGRMHGTYGGGMSHTNRGQHRVREHYSHAGRRRDRMGRYSGAGGGDIIEHVEMMMEETDDPREKEIIRRFKRELEKV